MCDIQGALEQLQPRDSEKPGQRETLRWGGGGVASQRRLGVGGRLAVWLGLFQERLLFL